MKQVKIVLGRITVLVICLGTTAAFLYADVWWSKHKLEVIKGQKISWATYFIGD